MSSLDISSPVIARSFFTGKDNNNTQSFEAAAVNKNPKETGSTYLPERYKQQIEAKKKRRLVKKIAATSVVIAICVVVYLVLSGGLLNSKNQSPLILPGPDALFPGNTSALPPGELNFPQSQNITTRENPGISIGGGVPAQPTVEMLSLDNATAFLRQEYPASAYTIISVNITDRYGNRNLYEFRIRKTGSVPGDTGFSAFVDAKTGDPYTPGQDSAKITADRAKLLIKEAFFIQNMDTVRVRYNYNPESVRAWIFSINHDNTSALTGTLDPETGQLLSFSRKISWEGRQADPLLDISAAQKIADRYIIDKNRGPLPVNMSDGQYYPLQVPQKTVAGHYVFVYNRIIQGIPCDSDGYTISVDSINGEVTGYDRRWNSPDSAFSVAVDPLVTRYEATFSILQRAKETYPESVNELTIVSAEIRWKDHQMPGSLPRPGSIPMAWKIQFTDAIIRAKPLSSPAVGWVDVQTGKILDFYYSH